MMTTLQSHDHSSSNFLKSENINVTLGESPEADTPKIGVKLPANSGTLNVNLPEILITDIIRCNDNVILHNENVETPDPTKAKLAVPTEISTTLLSASADIFLPAITLPPLDIRPYPPGLTGNGLEWSVSDSAWMALEYGKEDSAICQLKSSAEPDLKNIQNLKSLEVKLHNGIIFKDKVLPTADTEVIPHPKFSKEYFLDLHEKVRNHGTYNYAGARVKLEHSNLNIEMFRKHLEGYDDFGIISYIEYDFPLGSRKNSS